MTYKITDIEGVGPSYAEKLAAANIKTTDNLLELCCSKNGRSQVAQQTGVSESLLLKWSNMADMMRISGIGPQFAELLEASGVDTIKELAQRNAENLAQAISTTNEAKNLANAIPASSIIDGWIGAAKSTEPKITH